MISRVSVTLMSQLSIAKLVTMCSGHYVAATEVLNDLGLIT